MEFPEVIKRRFSCRQFLDTPVPAETVQALVGLAQRAPSWGNTQPWKTYAAGGETARRIREGQLLAFSEGRPSLPEVEMPAGFEPPLSDRYRDLGRALFAWLGIDRKDQDRRQVHYAHNLSAFGAPVLVYVTIPAGQTGYVILDAGAFVNAFCLAAADSGLATCILAALARYPEVVRQHLPIPGDEKILIGIALGYADPQAKANSFRSGREPVQGILSLRGFE